MRFIVRNPLKIAQLLRIPNINASGFSSFEHFLRLNSHAAGQLEIDNNGVEATNTKAELEIKKYKEIIKKHLEKEFEQQKVAMKDVKGVQEVHETDFYERRHAKVFQRIEEEIKRRDKHLRYLVELFNLMTNMSNAIEKMRKTAEKKELEVYEEVQARYQFGLANKELKDFSSINTSLKFMRKLFKSNNHAQVPKELFENLNNDQKRDLKSFQKMKFSALIKDKTIIKYKMPQLQSIIPNLRIIFFEDENFDIQVQVF
jgi:hypothetical protein